MFETLHDDEYLSLLQYVLEQGDRRPDRTGTGTRGLFGQTMSFDLADGFPLLTTKRVHWKSVALELLWMMSGSTNEHWLSERGVTIWSEWADENGELGPIYGKQWRDFNGVDQLQKLVDALKNDPFSRRHLVSAWNPAEIDEMALPPCHLLFQFWVSAETNKLSCQLYQRSADIFLGVPFNIASYALLTCILADTLGFERGTFYWVGGDVHLYDNHVDQAREQLSREPKPSPKLLPIMASDPLHVTYKDLKIVEYDPWPSIAAPVAV